MKRLPIPVFVLNRFDYETVSISWRHGRFNAALIPILGLDQPVLERADEVMVELSIQGHSSPMVPVGGQGKPFISRRDLIDGIRKGIRHVYRRARLTPIAYKKAEKLPEMDRLVVTQVSQVDHETLSVEIEVMARMRRRSMPGPDF